MPWAYANSAEAFVIPGNGVGEVAFPADSAATEFQITFTDMPAGAGIDGNPIGTTLYNSTDNRIWSFAFSPGKDSITFFAPDATALDPGDSFSVFLLMPFAGPTAIFTGAFDPQLAPGPSVPEPASFARPAGRWRPSSSEIRLASSGP